MTLAHKHEPYNRFPLPYVAPLFNAVKPNVMAHAGITRVDVCSCGAVRLANINQREAEFGRWLHLSKEERS